MLGEFKAQLHDPVGRHQNLRAILSQFKGDVAGFKLLDNAGSVALAQFSVECCQARCRKLGCEKYQKADQAQNDAAHDGEAHRPKIS